MYARRSDLRGGFEPGNVQMLAHDQIKSPNGVTQDLPSSSILSEYRHPHFIGRIQGTTNPLHLAFPYARRRLGRALPARPGRQGRAVCRNHPRRARFGRGGLFRCTLLHRSRGAAQDSGTNLLSANVDTLPGLQQTITATNLAELAGGTHLLAAGMVVQVFVLYTRESPGAKVYVFNQPPMQAVVVLISAAATGAGEYSGKIVGGAADASGATDLAMPAGMSVPASDNALVLNVEEDGESGHRLRNGSYVVGVVRGTTTDSPPRAIVIVRGGIGRTDSPATLGSTSDASESAESTTWSKATDGTPLNVYVVSRVVYNPAGDQALYSFVRMLSFDARGLLVSVGAETRVTVDATESCP